MADFMAAQVHLPTTVRKDNSILLGFAILAFALHVIPLQRYMPLGRYQHYGISIGAFGLGYLVQGALSWRNSPTLARIGYIATTVLFCSAGLLLLSNSGLDLELSLSGEGQQRGRYVLVVYAFFGLITSLIWLKLAQDDAKHRPPKGESDTSSKF
jgi:hypothetical protein